MVNPFKQTLLQKLNEFHPSKQQIHNVSESFLYWKLLPEKPYVGLEENRAPGKKQKSKGLTSLHVQMRQVIIRWSHESLEEIKFHKSFVISIAQFIIEILNQLG